MIFLKMKSLVIKELDIVNKFIGLHIELDDSHYVLNREITIDLLLKELELNSVNEVRPLQETCATWTMKAI